MKEKTKKKEEEQQPLKSLCRRFKISERLSCKELAILFANLAYIPDIRQNHSTFPHILKKNNPKFFLAEVPNSTTCSQVNEYFLCHYFWGWGSYLQIIGSDFLSQVTIFKFCMKSLSFWKIPSRWVGIIFKCKIFGWALCIISLTLGRSQKQGQKCGVEKQSLREKHQSNHRKQCIERA